MNWGYKILFVYLAFVGVIMFLVFKASFQKDDLVTTDYYGQELKYQQRIDDRGRADALSAELQYTIADGRLLINFPKDFMGKDISGNVVLYCPADEQKDIQQSFALLDNALAVGIPAGYKGSFELHISWSSAGKEYYYQKKIFI